ncbi:MAG: growth inhibitor [Candidatus Yonathbacteria bacterium CG_4_10_14_0_8_um_filter_43_17]|uniref:Growth inhibitor n=1 Tax=Candidatus Yonathbacteria bacterium CG_4_10_14_0_8_um_filter_43_17 TaxID=1975099 RepID=A0A2M7Q3V7_9BACT|nr:MAG: growth inhibitor [Candidatus Yonathbacteria bacterium CG_4_10_14_0_8_um_filter_43_17]
MMLLKINSLSHIINRTQFMTKFKFGDVVMVVSTQVDGNRKQRPALVIPDTGDDDIVLASITTTERKSKRDYKIKNWNQSGLLLGSWARLAKIACLSKSDVCRKLGAFSQSDKGKVALVWRKLYKI